VFGQFIDRNHRLQHALADKRGKGRIDFADRAGIDDLDLQPEVLDWPGSRQPRADRWLASISQQDPTIWRLRFSQAPDPRPPTGFPSKGWFVHCTRTTQKIARLRKAIPGVLCIRGGRRASSWQPPGCH
jgi:hypothetical protein